jgi:hypothetical protein
MSIFLPAQSTLFRIIPAAQIDCKSVCAFRRRYWSWVETRVAVNPITARHSDKRFQSRKNRRVNSRVKRREIARQRIVVGRFYCTQRSLRNCLLQA